MSEKIFEIKTDDGSELKTLFEVLRDVLHETTIEIIKGTPSQDEEKSDNESSSSSESEEEVPKKKQRGRKPKKEAPKKKKAVKKIESSSSDESGSEDESNKKKKVEGKPGGFRILTVNEFKTLIVYVKLHAKHFLKFNCKYETYDIGVDLALMHQFFKSIDKDGILTIYVEKDAQDKIVFEVENEEKGIKTNYKLKLMDLQKEKHEIPPPIFDVMVTMETAEFHRVCRDISGVSEYLGITCTNKAIEFKSVGDSSEFDRTFVHSKGVVKIKSVKNDPNKPSIIKQIYQLKYITLFQKCQNLCPEIQIFLKNEFPLFVKYTIANKGDMTIGFVPVDEKLVNKNMNYDEGLDKYYDNDVVKLKKK
jgi:proliferating cell nuclear antigen